MLATLLRGGAQLLLNLATLSEVDLDTHFEHEVTFRKAVIDDLKSLAKKEQEDMDISDDQVAQIKAGQTQLATDLSNDGVAFQQGLADLKTSYQTQIDTLNTALTAANVKVPIDLTDVNNAFAALHTQATSLINFGMAAGAPAPPQTPVSGANAPAPVVTLPPASTTTQGGITQAPTPDPTQSAGDSSSGASTS